MLHFSFFQQTLVSVDMALVVFSINILLSSFLPAYKVSITSFTEENVFIKYTATLLDVYKAGENSLIHFSIQQIFSTYYVPGILLDMEDTTSTTQPVTLFIKLIFYLRRHIFKEMKLNNYKKNCSVCKVC